MYELLVEIRAAVNDRQVSRGLHRQSKLLMDIVTASHTCIHNTWRITSTTTEGLFRT